MEIVVKTQNPYTMKRLFFLLLVFLLGSGARAQYYPLPEFNHSWNSSHVTKIPVNELFMDAPAVVLSSRLDLSVRGRKEPAMYVYFEHRKRIAIQGTDGEEVPFSKIMLPESADPFYDTRELPLTEKPAVPTAEYLNVRVLFFAVRKIHPDGSTSPIEFRDSFEEGRILIEDRYENQFKYAFYLDGLRPGDEVELHYKYEVPYDVNWPFFNDQRVFFHEQYPVQHKQVEFSKPKNLSTVLYGSEPDLSWEVKDREYHKWTKENLPGCIREPGIRPDRDLPYLLYSLYTKNPRYEMRLSTSGKAIYADYTSAAFRTREQNTFQIRRLELAGEVRGKQSEQLARFIAENTPNQPDPHPLMIFDRMHATITDDFEWVPSDAYYAEKDMSLVKLGNRVSNNELVESSRNELYKRLANRMGELYYSIYMLDKRIGTLTKDYQANQLFSDWALGLPFDSYLNVYVPKKQRFGYYVNEFPFYLAGTRAFAVDVDRLVGQERYFPELITLPEIPEENYRHSAISVAVNSQSYQSTGTIQVDLSGQYSTLTRSVYAFGQVDSSINPAYGLRYFYGVDAELGPDSLVQSNKYAPFFHQYRTDFTAASLASRDSENDCSISLNGMFPFVMWPDFDKTERVLPFYADFPGEDVVRMTLKFDQPVTLQNGSELTVDVENRFGSVRLNCSQTESDEILVEVTYKLFADRVEPRQAHLIANLYNALDEINMQRLLVNWASTK